MVLEYATRKNKAGFEAYVILIIWVMRRANEMRVDRNCAAAATTAIDGILHLSLVS